ncbi:MAG TPA: hypothetical protein VLV81_05595 [Acidimicrobiia bacterium]|nr:hypothetical protein [Acidimicrobiia bacterium]
MGQIPTVELLGARPGSAPQDPRDRRADRPTGTDAAGPVRGTARGSGRPLLLAVLAVAVTLLGVALARHAMWFDELQAWNIARASRSIPDLFHHLRYEGHPAAWYLALYALTRVTGDPRAMQAVELLIVAGTYAVILFASPFSKPVRVALLAGYTISFEYGVITRAYGLGVLGLVATLALLGRSRPRWRWALVPAVVLAWTNLAGAVVAVSLAAAVTGRHARASRTTGPDRDQRWFAGGTVVAAVGAAITCVPPADFHAFTPSVNSGATTGWNRLLTAAAGTWRGLLPVPARLGGWNSQFLDRLPAAAWVEAALSVVVVVVVAGALRRSGIAWRLWLLGSGGVFVFFAVAVLPDQSRYAVTVFLVFLGAAWWAVAPPGGADPAPGAEAPRRVSPMVRQVIAVVVAAQVVALLAVYPSQATHRFAPNQAVADAVRTAGLQSRVVSGEDFDATSAGAYLDQPVYSVARHAWIRYFVHDDREARGYQHLGLTAVLCAARGLARAARHDTAVITQAQLVRLGPGVNPVATVDAVTVLRVRGDAVLPRCSITR